MTLDMLAKISAAYLGLFLVIAAMSFLLEAGRSMTTGRGSLMGIVVADARGAG